MSWNSSISTTYGYGGEVFVPWNRMVWSTRRCSPVLIIKVLQLIVLDSLLDLHKVPTMCTQLGTVTHSLQFEVGMRCPHTTQSEFNQDTNLMWPSESAVHISFVCKLYCNASRAVQWSYELRKVHWTDYLFHSVPFHLKSKKSDVRL